jgi:hypothetical protein
MNLYIVNSIVSSLKESDKRRIRARIFDLAKNGFNAKKWDMVKVKTRLMIRYHIWDGKEYHKREEYKPQINLSVSPLYWDFIISIFIPSQDLRKRVERGITYGSTRTNIFWFSRFRIGKQRFIFICTRYPSTHLWFKNTILYSESWKLFQNQKFRFIRYCDRHLPMLSQT